MQKTLIQVTQDAARLPAVDRLKLARFLLDLSETTRLPVAEVQAAWDDEIEQRWQELRAGSVQAVPRATVKKQIEAGFRA